MVLVGYWPLDEDSGTTATDYSRNNNNGSLTSASARNSGDSVSSTTVGNGGIVGASSYEFDVDGYVDVDAYSVDGSSAVTISGWINSNYTSNWNGPFGFEGDIDNNYGFFFRYNDSNDSFELNVNGNSYSVEYNNVSEVYDGNWHLLMGLFDNGEVVIFLDGKRVVSKSVSATTVSTNQEFYIGRYYWEHSDDHWGFEGRIQNVRLYNHALTKQEVQYLYQVGSRGLHTSDKRTL